MIEIDDTFVDATAPNANAIASAKTIVNKGKFAWRRKDPDETLIFAECLGSGKSNYQTSVDFTDPSNPVYRCTCPSRQFPCKHALALMYAWVRGAKFETGEVPEDVASKRDKAKVRAEKKLEAKATPTKRNVNKKALAKKIDAQLDGLDVLETIVHDLVRGGLGTLNAKSARMLSDQAKALGNAYLPGAQSALNAFVALFDDDSEETGTAQRERIYTEALDRLARVQMICKRGREYLTERKADPELKPNTESTIAEWLGHAWQLAELKEHGLYEQNAELVQLAFRSYDDAARKEYVDVGVWLNLKTGTIQLTKNYRPYRAARYIKEDDCFFHVMQVPELYVYPGDLNPRIRWDESAHRMLERSDMVAARGLARGSLADAIKAVKGQLKDPLADRNPYALLSYSSIGLVGDRYVVEDAAGDRLAMTDGDGKDDLATVYLLGLLPEALLGDQVMLVRFIPDLDRHRLQAKPLSVLSSDGVVRLSL